MARATADIPDDTSNNTSRNETDSAITSNSVHSDKATINGESVRDGISSVLGTESEANGNSSLNRGSESIANGNGHSDSAYEEN